MAHGPSILIVEDSYLLAQDLTEMVQVLGHAVCGPTPTVAGAMGLMTLEPPAAAIVDLDLAGEPAFAVLDALLAREIPVALCTACAPEALPARFQALPRLTKPPGRRELGRFLDGALGGP